MTDLAVLAGQDHSVALIGSVLVLTTLLARGFPIRWCLVALGIGTLGALATLAWQPWDPLVLVRAVEWLGAPLSATIMGGLVRGARLSARPAQVQASREAPGGSTRASGERPDGKARKPWLGASPLPRLP